MPRRNRKRQNLQRALIGVGYALLGAFVVLVTVGLVAYGQGYWYDFQSKRIIQTGIVMIQSNPSGVPVRVDGKLLKKKTPFRISYESGQSHTFELSKSGYHPWSKVLTTVASEVTLAQYALLVPVSPVRTIVGVYKNIGAQAISSDQRRMAYAVDEGTGSISSVYALALDNAKPARIFTPSTPAAGHPAETIAGIVWSDDASHLLITTQAGSVTTHYVVSADGSDVVNLNAKFGSDLAGITFSGNNWRQLYWISPEGLRRIDLGAQTVSEILADKVSQFSVTDSDRVLYVQSAALGHSLWSMDGKGQKQELVPALAPSDRYVVVPSTYSHTDVVGVIPSATGIGTLYSDIYSSNPVATTIAHDVTNISFSPTGHSVVFWSDKQATTYDLEKSDLSGRATVYNFPPFGGVVKTLSWYDDFHVLVDAGDEEKIMEFDGGNPVALSQGVAPLTATASPSLRNIFFFQQAPGAVIVETVGVKN